MILGQDMFHCIHPLEYFETDGKNTPISVRLPLGWVSSYPLPWTSGLISTCFKAVTQRETDSKLADQIRCWYDIESYWAYEQVGPRSAADARAQKILQDTAYHVGCQYAVGMIWADGQFSLPNNYFSALVQLKSLERRLGKYPNLKEQYSTTVHDDRSQRIISSKSTCFKTDQLNEWYLPHHPVIHPHNSRKVRRILKSAAEFHGHSLNNALLTGPDFLQTSMQRCYSVSASNRMQFLLTSRECFAVSWARRMLRSKIHTRARGLCIYVGLGFQSPRFKSS